MTAKCCQAFTAGRGLHFNCQVRHDHRRAMPGRSGVERICTARIAPYAFARAEMEADPRYLWGDDVPAAAVRRLLAWSHAMVLSSLSEGGANVISEAAVAGVPVLARGRQCRAARRRLSRLLPRRRHASAGAPAAAARARAALRRPAGPRRLPDARRCSGRRVRSSRGAGCSPRCGVAGNLEVPSGRIPKTFGDFCLKRRAIGNGLSCQSVEAHSAIGGLINPGEAIHRTRRRSPQGLFAGPPGWA